MSTSQPIPVRGRFAPSPSGRMHLGNLCCALLAWLSVRSQNGEMLLRIEDLDPDRCTREKAELLMDDLTWLGLTWDEGPGHERTHAPYCQSARRELYESALSELRAPCGRWHVPLPRFMPKFDARRSRRKKPHAPPKHAFSRTRGHRYI